MVINADSKEIRLIGNKYEYIGINQENEWENHIDLICDEHIDIFLNKPLYVSGNLRANSIRGGRLEVHGYVDIESDAVVNSLWTPSEDVTIGHNLFANYVDCFNLEVGGSAYVEESIHCDGVSININGELRSKAIGTLSVKTNGALRVNLNADIKTVNAHDIEIGGYLKTVGDISVGDCLKVEGTIRCGGRIRYEDINPDNAYER